MTVMNVAVVCEGPTDYPAIKHFFGQALVDEKKVDVNFSLLHPDLDNTLSGADSSGEDSLGAGWGNIFFWLQRYEPGYRVRNYLSGGLFGGSLSKPKYDAIIVQIDCDILSDDSFINYAEKQFDFRIVHETEPDKKARQFRRLLEIACGFSDMAEVDQKRHVIALAVEATETWCLAAFNRQGGNFETLVGAELTTAFMQALEKSEGKEPQAVYANTNKDRNRRERFCEKHKGGANRVVRSCPHFSEAFEQLQNLCP